MNHDWRKLSRKNKGHLWVDNQFRSPNSEFKFRSLCGMQYAQNYQELIAVPNDEKLLCKVCLCKATEQRVLNY